MIDNELIVSGGVDAGNGLLWQSIVLFNPFTFASIDSDNAIDLGAQKDLGAVHPLFLRGLFKALAPISFADTAKLTIEVRAAHSSSLLDWVILSSTGQKNLQSFVDIGCFSLGIPPSAEMYRYLYVRYFFENTPAAMRLQVFADFGMEQLVPKKYYPSGWVIA